VAVQLVSRYEKIPTFLKKNLKTFMNKHHIKNMTSQHRHEAPSLYHTKNYQPRKDWRAERKEIVAITETNPRGVVSS
jgi:hypothetical protein